MIVTVDHPATFPHWQVKHADHVRLIASPILLVYGLECVLRGIYQFIGERPFIKEGDMGHMPGTALKI
jgi:hypothetical protein